MNIIQIIISITLFIVGLALMFEINNTVGFAQKSNIFGMITMWFASIAVLVSPNFEDD